MCGKTNRDLTLFKVKNLSIVFAYSDVDYAGSLDMSTTSCTIFMGPNLISWSSKKQPTVSNSPTIVENQASAYTIIETLWIHYVLVELGVVLHHPVKVLCDNISNVYIAANPILYEHSKHVKVDYHYV